MVGVASLKDAHTVQVHRPDGSEVNLTAGTVLIATGSSPFHPPEVPFDHQVIYDSDSILQMSHIPKSMIIVGGGVIGSEYASIFTALGAGDFGGLTQPAVALVDHEIAERLQQQMEQARVAMVHAFNLRYKEQVSPILPLAVYTIPEISLVGLSEDDCQKKEIPYFVGCAYYENNARGQIIGDLSGLLKLVFSPSDEKLLSVHLFFVTRAGTLFLQIRIFVFALNLEDAFATP
jgi:pyruvate/2-oxoglutarate dehydrogenase complex dihydrolipoamide dehydrogenase (E3) component